jgi:hypothetical protein
VTAPPPLSIDPPDDRPPAGINTGHLDLLQHAVVA